MAEQMRVNQPIDWSNPNDPKTKEALNLLFHALVEENLINEEIRHILTVLYLTEKREDLQRSEELAAHADQEIKKFWETLRPDASQAMKNKDKDALTLCINAVSVKIDDLQNQNRELSATINMHQHDIASATTAWKARQLENRAEVASKLEGRMTDIHGNIISAEKIKEILKQAAPVDIDKRFAQKDFHAKIEGVMDGLGKEEKQTVCHQIAAADDVFSEMKVAAIGRMENGEPPTGGKFLKAVMELKAINAFKRSVSNKNEDAADIQNVYHAQKKKSACEKQVEENQKKITMLEGAQKSLQGSLNVLDNKNAGHEHAAEASNIPEAPPPPPVMRRK